MQIKVGLNGAYYKLEVDQKELNEIYNALGYSDGEPIGTGENEPIDENIRQHIVETLGEFVTE